MKINIEVLEMTQKFAFNLTPAWRVACCCTSLLDGSGGGWYTGAPVGNFGKDSFYPTLSFFIGNMFF